MNIADKLRTLFAYVEDINVDIIEDEVIPGITVDEWNQLKETLGMFDTLTDDGIKHLIDVETYRTLIYFGKDTTADKLNVLNELAGYKLTADALANTLDFSYDLYDDNELSGWNDEHYPNRKR